MEWLFTILRPSARGLQIGSPEHELVRLLGLAGFPEPVVVERVAGTILGRREVPWREFVCRRNEGEGRRAAYDRGYGFRIEFAEDVRGPGAGGDGVRGALWDAGICGWLAKKIVLRGRIHNDKSFAANIIRNTGKECLI